MRSRAPSPATQRALFPRVLPRVDALERARRRGSGATFGASNGAPSDLWQRETRRAFYSATSRGTWDGAANLGARPTKRVREAALEHAMPDHHPARPRVAARADPGRYVAVEHGTGEPRDAPLGVRVHAWISKESPQKGARLELALVEHAQTSFTTAKERPPGFEIVSHGRPRVVSASAARAGQRLRHGAAFELLWHERTLLPPPALAHVDSCRCPLPGSDLARVLVRAFSRARAR